MLCDNTVKKRFIVFDIFRAVSAIMIVLYHYTTRYEESIGHLLPYKINFNFGYMFVSVFFILTGYLTIMNLKENDSILNFGYKKIARLYPTYWISIVITSIFMFFLMKERLKSIGVIFVNFTMLNYFFGIESVDGVYWTLAIDILFYCFVGLILLFKQYKNISIISFIWIVFSIFINVYLKYSSSKLFNFLSILLISKYSQMFIAGIILFLLSKNKKSSLLYLTIILCIINHTLIYSINYSIFFSIIIIILYLLTLFNRHKYIVFSNLATKIIFFISSISYPLYLIHQNIGFAIIKNIENSGLTSEFYLFIPITISITISTLIHFCVEIPTYKHLMKKNPFTK